MGPGGWEPTKDLWSCCPGLGIIFRAWRTPPPPHPAATPHPTPTFQGLALHQVSRLETGGSGWPGTRILASAGLKGFKARNLPSEGAPTPIPTRVMSGEDTEARWVRPRDVSRNSPEPHTHITMDPQITPSTELYTHTSKLRVTPKIQAPMQEPQKGRHKVTRFGTQQGPAWSQMQRLH